MGTYRIAEAAAQVGVATTTLRFYEEIGLIAAPARAGNGYRTYTDADLARLLFITRVKNLGVPLDEVRVLVTAYEVDDCSTVAHQVVELVAARLGETQERIAELVALAAQLEQAAARLSAAPADGTCGPACACCVETPAAPLAPRTTFVPLTRKPQAPARTPVACSLPPVAIPGRLDRWQAVLAQAVRRKRLADGVSVVFAPGAELGGELAALAAAEQDCCPFLTFGLHLTTGELRLDVHAPADAQDVVTALIGHAP